MLNKLIKISLAGITALSLAACAAPSANTGDADDNETGKAEKPAETKPETEVDDEVSEVITEASGLTSGPLTIVANDGEDWEGSAEQDIAYKFIRTDGTSTYAVYVTDNGELDTSYDELQQMVDETLVDNSKAIYVNGGWEEDKVQVTAETIEIDGKTFPGITQHAESDNLIQDETDVLVLKNGKLYVIATICGSPDGTHKKPSEVFSQFKIDADGLE